MEKKKVNGSANRRRGHNAERALAKLFRSMGFIDCKTTRETSSLLDSVGIDLDYLPIIVQSKAGVTEINPVTEIRYIQERRQLLPDEESEWKVKPIVIINIRKAARPRRDELDDVVSMTLKDFMIIFGKAYKYKEQNGDISQNTEERDRGILQQFRNEPELTKNTD